MERVRRFEFVGGESAKFWEINQIESQVTVRFGRLGTNGQTQTKDLGSETAAAAHVAKLIKEKLAKGYVETSGEEALPGLPAKRIDFKTGIVRPPVLPPYEVPPLPADGPVDINGVRLPPGRRLWGDPSMAPPGIAMIMPPVAWLTDAPVADSGSLFYRLRGPLAAMGLVPMLLAGMEGDETRPWDSHEFSPTDPRRTDHFDAGQVLADMWRDGVNEEDEETLVPVQPFGLEFPGLAAAPAVNPPSGFGRLFAKPNDPADDRAVLAALSSRRIGLVAASRPADAITALGWAGAVNVHQDPTLMSAVLRSWEDRWGARVVEIGFDTLTVSVGIPPRDRQTALALAAEHFAFCPDNIWQGVGTLLAYAASLQQSRIWTFWWD
jgi:predicted DNA-binding WGR domain protein